MDKITIVVVGAGPVGMCTALSLARAGLSVTLIEAKTCLQKTGSRAIVIDNAALAHLQDIGSADQILAEALIAKCRRTFFRGRELFCHEFPRCPKGLPLFANLPQSRTEAILFEQIRQTPNIQVLLGHQVVSVSQTENGVRIRVKCKDREFEIGCGYLVAADGCRSAVRNACNLEFPGSTNPYRFMIVDVRADIGHPHEHQFHFDHPMNPGHTLLMVPQPDNVWRIDWQLPRGVEPENDSEAIQRRVEGVIRNVPFEVCWQSCYQFHQRLMTKMSHGRIYFVGDSAHLVNPFGGRGMNAGFADARSLAAKIIRVRRGEKPESHLETYAIERGIANRIHQQITCRSMKFIAPPTRLGRMKRDAILRGSHCIPYLRRFVDSGRMSMTDPRTHQMDFPSLS